MDSVQAWTLFLAAETLDQCVEDILRDLDHLGRGLVSLLVLDQTRSLFVEVDAGDGHMARLRQMAMETIKMVTNSVDSFLKKDAAAAKAVIDYDDVVDGLFNEVKKELVALIAAMPENGEAYVDILMVAKYFERIGDHATNIAENVWFLVHGDQPLPPRDKRDETSTTGAV